MAEPKYLFMPSADESTHVPCNTLEDVADLMQAHLYRVAATSRMNGSPNFAIHMQDCDFGPRGGQKHSGMVVLYYPDVTKESMGGELLDGSQEGIAVAFVKGVGTKDYLGVAHKPPDFWRDGDGQVHEYEKPPQRLN